MDLSPKMHENKFSFQTAPPRSGLVQQADAPNPAIGTVDSITRAGRGAGDPYR